MKAATVRLTKAQDRILVSSRDTPGGHPIRDHRELKVVKELARQGFVIRVVPDGHTRTLWGDSKIIEAGREYLAKREAEKGLSQ